MKPNFFIIGASKCGTTYLHGLLVQHPEICSGELKEPFFFQREDYLNELDWYESLYSDCRQVTYACDASPTYSETIAFPDIAKRLHDYMPTAKILYIVREPFSRLNSAWTQALSTGHWHEQKFYENKMPKIRREAVFNYPPMLDACRYWTHISSYRREFADSQVKIVLFDDLIENTSETLSDIYAFLDIPWFEPVFESADTNQSQGKKPLNPLMRNLRRRIPSSAAKFVPGILKGLIERTSDRIYNKGIEQTALTDEDCDQIIDTLAPEIEALYSHLGIQDDPWGFFLPLDNAKRRK